MEDGNLRIIRHFLRKNHQYKDLPDKAVHKLSYLVYEEVKEKGIDFEVPYFWYRYGVITHSNRSQPTNEQLTELDKREEEILNNISNRVLEEYYNTSLQDITDHTYEDVPYEVFTHWRALDKQLTELKDNYNPFFDNTPIREDIENKIEAVYDSFPASDYPQHQNDLSTWYFAMTRVLDRGLENIARLHETNTTFWGIFTLSVAQRQRHNMSEKEVQQALSIRSFESELRERRRLLQELDSEGREDRFEGRDSSLNTTTDAIIEPILESL